MTTTAKQSQRKSNKGREIQSSIKNEQLEPITIGDGKILDGRSRAKACGMLGVETNTTEFPGNDPLGFVLSKNVRRRHLSKSQLAMTAVKLANIADEEDEL